MIRSVESFLRRVAGGELLRVVLLGDSITAGSQIDPHADPQIVYHKQWHDRVLAAERAARLQRINLGVPGNKAGDGLLRFSTEVTPQLPDLLVIAFGINDCWQGPDGLSQFEQDLEGLVRLANAETDAAVALMTTNMMNHRVDAETLEMAPFARQSMTAETSGWTAAYMQRVRDVAARHSLAVIDGYARWLDYADRGNDPDELLANGANHPNRAGHALLADAMWDVFSSPQWRPDDATRP